MSECAAVRHILAPYCKGLTLELGFGGDATVPHAITFDTPVPYTKVAGERQILRGDCRDLSFICNDAFATLVSHHLLEDFTYSELPAIIREWRRVLRPGGLLITNCPTQSKFLAHCAKTGQGTNAAHKESTFSLATFKQYAIEPTGPWETVMEDDNVGPYSWILILRKI